LIWQFFSVSCFFLQQDKTMKVAWRNGFVTILKQPLYALIISLVMLALLVLSFYVYIPLVLGSIPLIAILGLKAVRATIEARLIVPALSPGMGFDCKDRYNARMSVSIEAYLTPVRYAHGPSPRRGLCRLCQHYRRAWDLTANLSNPSHCVQSRCDSFLLHTPSSAILNVLLN
jgi:hypothetical protein